MKKLMILAAAAVMAGFANAASVSWNSGAVYNPNSGGESKIGKQTGDWIMTVAYYTFDSTKSEYVSFAASGDLSDDSTMVASKFSGESTGFENGKTYYVDAIITDKAGNWTIDTGKVAFTTQTTGDSTIQFDDGTGLTGGIAWDTTSIGETGDTGVWVAAVPEPTSGLLLLLGMAGLALRRRRA